MTAAKKTSQRLVYRGRVLPEILELTVEYEPHFRRTEADSPDAEVRISAKLGVLTAYVDVEVEGDLRAAADALVLPVLEHASSFVESVGFVQGVPYSVILDEIHFPDHTIQPIILADRKLARFCTAYGLDDLEAVTELLVSDVQLMRLLSDVLMMLSIPSYAPISCGRAADGIVRSMTGGRSPSHWDEMLQAKRGSGVLGFAQNALSACSPR